MILEFLLSFSSKYRFYNGFFIFEHLSLEKERENSNFWKNNGFLSFIDFIDFSSKLNNCLLLLLTTDTQKISFNPQISYYQENFSILLNMSIERR